MISFHTVQADVDGYEELKFGMSEEEILAKKPCTTKKSKDSFVTTYTCDDFQIYGVDATANFDFISNEFLKISITNLSEESLLQKIRDGLKNKYGEPSSKPSKEEIEVFGKEGGTVSGSFSNDTITYSLTIDKVNKKVEATLVYLSKDFERLIEEKKNTPVDGYKDLKFGMSEEEILAKKPCTTKEIDVSDTATFIVAHMCEDFKFAGAKTTAYFYFIDDKLLKFVINGIPTNLGEKIGEGLVKKYGEPTSTTKEKELEKLSSTGGSLQLAAFANDTISVIMNVPKGNPDGIKFRLDYVSADFERLKDEKRQDALEDDL